METPRRFADYLSLTKPGIISLQIISTLAAMVIAAGGAVSAHLCLWTLAGGSLMSGSAGVFNCIWDADIDALMTRTSSRPMPNQRISTLSAAFFGILIGAAGFAILLTRVNALAAWLSLAGHIFYSVVYTILLKRRTPLNVVIGGAAGGIPPLVGWAAVTGHISISAVLLFIVICLWTPPHFWALALVENEDYRRAGLPMLPVIAGPQRTVTQMSVYVLLLIPVSIWLVLSDTRLGSLPLLILPFLGFFFYFNVRNLNGNPSAAQGTFRFSLMYLSAFFLVLMADVLI